MEIAITTISSKGQIVIPTGMRKGMIEGDKFLIMRSKNQLILKKASELDTQFKKEIARAARIEEAWKRYDNKEFKTLEFDDFIAEMKKW